MELRRYLELTRRWWWIAATAFVVTTTATLFLVLPQPEVYEATSTFVVAPSALTAEGSVEAFDTLIRGEAIPATYVSIAGSDLVRRRAEARLEESVSTSDLSVTAEVLTGTNIVSITVNGTDPRAVLDMAVAVGAETVAYVEHDQAYRLETLDPPSLPEKPVGPDKTLTIAVGVGFGALLGVSLALITEYLVGQLRPSIQVHSHDLDTPRAFGPVATEAGGALVPVGEMRLNGSDRRSFVYGEQEFRLRFRHEVIRAKRTGHTFSLGLVNVALSGGRDADLSYVPARRDLLRIAQAVRPTLLEGDVLACLEDGTLAALLPGVPAAEAEELLRGWKPTIGWILHQEKGEDFSAPNISTAVCECNGDGFVGPPEAERIAQMLTEGRPPGDIASRASAARVGRADSRK